MDLWHCCYANANIYFTNLHFSQAFQGFSLRCSALNWEMPGSFKTSSCENNNYNNAYTFKWLTQLYQFQEISTHRGVVCGHGFILRINPEPLIYDLIQGIFITKNQKSNFNSFHINTEKEYN